MEGREGARLRLTRSAVAFAMMCPTLLLRPLKKAARLEVLFGSRVATAQPSAGGWQLRVCIEYLAGLP